MLFATLMADKLQIKDKNRFFIGSILTDSYINPKDRNKAHFQEKLQDEDGRYIDFKGFYERFRDKVMDDDLYLGYYAHLVEDACYRRFLYIEKDYMVKLRSYEVSVLHKDYAILNSYISREYDIPTELAVPQGFETEKINEIAAFGVEQMIQDYKQDISERIDEEPVLLTEKWLEEFVAEYKDIIEAELCSVRNGGSTLDVLDYKWLHKRERFRILVVMQATEEHKRLISEAAPDEEVLFADASAVDEETVKSADIIIGNLAPQLIAGSRRLKLLQLNNAGTDGYTDPGILPEQAVLTNATGAYGVAISEHMMGMLLCMMKKMNLYQDNMREGKWKDMGPVPTIYGSNTLVVGLGDIGGEFAKRMRAMGSRVTGIRRTEAEKPEYLEALYQMDHFYESLEQADIVAACLPGTAATRKVFDEAAFSHMKDGAYFVNIGRGSAVDTEALIKALNSGKIAGACLDVTDPEPLPEDHPLWKAPNVFITPHVSGGYHTMETHNRIIGIAVRNIRHVLQNEPLENIVDMTTGYRAH